MDGLALMAPLRRRSGSGASSRSKGGGASMGRHWPSGMLELVGLVLGAPFFCLHCFGRLRLLGWAEAAQVLAAIWEVST